MNALESVQALIKALEEGGYNMPPENLKQGSAFDVPTIVHDAYMRGEKLDPQVEHDAWKELHIWQSGYHSCEMCDGK